MEIVTFVVTSIAIPILLSVLVGLPLSIYAGFICARIVVFNETQNRITEIVVANSGPFAHSSDIETAARNVELLDVIADRLHDLGHVSFGKVVGEIAGEMQSSLSKLETDFSYSEIRQKHEPSTTIIPNAVTAPWFRSVESGSPALLSVLSFRPRL